MVHKMQASMVNAKKIQPIMLSETQSNTQNYMKKNTNSLVSAVNLLDMLIKNGYHNQSTTALRNMVQSWIDDIHDDQSPVSYLGEEKFIRYLYYLLVYKLDVLIGNEQPFVPNQDYEQEYNRFIKSYLLSMNDIEAKILTSTEQNYVTSFGCVIEPKVTASNSRSNQQYFTETTIKSILSDSTYANFVKFKELDETDALINNCRPICLSQNYEQELIRLSRTPELIELIKKDSSYEELFYTVDCAIQDRFLRGLGEPSPNVTIHQITKLW